MLANFDKYGKLVKDVDYLKQDLTPSCFSEHGMRGFTGAEFEFASCPAFSKGIMRLAKGGMYTFTVAGEKYREKIVWWMKNVRGFSILPEWIVTTHGTIFSLATTIRMVTEPGDSIIIMTPTYNRYEQAAKRLNRSCTKVPLKFDGSKSNGYSIDFSALEEAFKRDECKLLVLCNPNNPTGTAFSSDDLTKIAALSEKYGVYVFSDEIFAEVAFEGRLIPSYAQISSGRQFAITCTSLGKMFSLTGVNHANVIIEDCNLRDKYIIQRNSDHYGSLDPMVHAGILESFNDEGKEFVSSMNDYVWENYCEIDDFMKKNMPAVRVERPQGTYVVWVDYSMLNLPRGNDNADSPVSLEQLLTKGMFIGDWGEDYYGSEQQMRYSIACPHSEVKKALSYLKKAIDELL